MDPTFDRIAELAAQLLSVPIAGFALLANPDRLDQGIELPGAVGFPDPIQRARHLVLPDPVTARLLARGEPLVFSYVGDDALMAKAAAQVGASLGAAAAYPLFGFAPAGQDRRASGALVVFDSDQRAWTEAELNVLRDLAELGSSELSLRREQERAWAAERSAKQALQDAQLLLTMSEAFAEVTTTREVEEAISALARNSLGAASARLAVVQDDRRHIAYVSTGPEIAGRNGAAAGVSTLRQTHEGRASTSGASTTVGGGPARLASLSDDLPVCSVARTGRTQFYSTATLLRREYPMLSEHQDFAGACLLLPVHVGERTRAVICLRWAGPREFDHSMAAVESALGPFVAHALDRVLLLEARRSVATTLQSAMLTPPPHVPGLEIATTYAPARRTNSVGGDWYDAIVVDEDTTVLVIGDVAGHDMRAAANMGQLRSMLRALAWSHPELSPAKLLTMLDQANAKLGPGAGATSIVVRLRKSREPGAYELTWSNAGHLPPLVLRATGAVDALKAQPDLVLGLVPDTERVDHVSTLEPGETLLLYTDGLVETRGENLQERIGQLETTLAASAGTATATLPGALVRSMVRLPLRDDVAALAVRARNPVALQPVGPTATDHPADQRPMPVLHGQRDIAADVSDLAPTRRWLDDILEADGLAPETRQTATLLANELVTNAVRHAVAPISATVQSDPNAGTLRFSVSDGSPEPPVLRYPEPEETSGRGVQLVARLAAHWGFQVVEPDGTQAVEAQDVSDATGSTSPKTVWFELQLPR